MRIEEARCNAVNECSDVEGKAKWLGSPIGEYNKIKITHRGAPDLDPDPAGSYNTRIRKNPDLAGSKQFGSGQPD